MCTNIMCRVLLTGVLIGLTGCTSMRSSTTTSQRVLIGDERAWVPVHVSSTFSTADSAAYMEKMWQAYELGVQEAENELKANRPRWKLWGLRSDSGDRRRDLYRTYGVRPHVVAGCIVESGEVISWMAYNSRIATAMDEIHGDREFSRNIGWYWIEHRPN